VPDPEAEAVALPGNAVAVAVAGPEERGTTGLMLGRAARLKCACLDGLRAGDPSGGGTWIGGGRPRRGDEVDIDIGIVMALSSPEGRPAEGGVEPDEAVELCRIPLGVRVVRAGRSGRVVGVDVAGVAVAVDVDVEVVVAVAVAPCVGAAAAAGAAEDAEAAAGAAGSGSGSWKGSSGTIVCGCGCGYGCGEGRIYSLKIGRSRTGIERKTVARRDKTRRDEMR